MGPYYTVEAKDKGASDSLIGLIFAINQFGGFVVSFILGKVMAHHRKWIMIFSAFLMILSLLGFAFCIFIEDYNIFVIISLLCRLIQGIVFILFYFFLVLYLHLHYININTINFVSK